MKHNTEHDKPYWRGPIWININYLALSALYSYSSKSSVSAGLSSEQIKLRAENIQLAKNIYSRLRSNVIRNIYDQFLETGYIWEQYNDGENQEKFSEDGMSKKAGKGQGTFPFTGWSALVVLIMSEKY